MPTAGPPQLRAVLLRMLVLAGVWAGLVGLLIAAGEIVTHSAALTHFDQRATRVVVSWRTPALDSAMKAVTWLGSWVAVLVTAVIIAVLVITGRLPGSPSPGTRSAATGRPWRATSTNPPT